MLQTIAYFNHMDIQGIKLQLLHVLTGTDLAADYGKPLLCSRDAGVYSVARHMYLAFNPAYGYSSPDRRRTEGSFDRPSLDKKKRTVLNQLHSHLKEKDIWQGKEYHG